MPWPLHGFQIDLTVLTLTVTYTEKLGSGRHTLWWRYISSSEIQCTCYIKLNLSRGLLGEPSQAAVIQEEAAVVDVFCSTCQYLYLDQGKALPSHGSEDWGPWYDCAHVDNTHSHRISTQDFICPSHPRGWDYRHFTIPRLCGSGAVDLRFSCLYDKHFAISSAQ